MSCLPSPLALFSSCCSPKGNKLVLSTNQATITIKKGGTLKIVMTHRHPPPRHILLLSCKLSSCYTVTCVCSSATATILPLLLLRLCSPFSLRCPVIICFALRRWGCTYLNEFQAKRQVTSAPSEASAAGRGREWERNGAANVLCQFWAPLINETMRNSTSICVCVCLSLLLSLSLCVSCNSFFALSFYHNFVSFMSICCRCQ